MANRKIFQLVVLLLGALCAGLPADEASAVQRYGLFVGANDGGRARIPLRYAVSDARAMAEVMGEIGGVEGENSALLVNPRPAELRGWFDSARARLLINRGGARRVEFLFYYSGHSDENGLLLGGESVAYRDLRDSMSRLGADVTIAILDSCSSGAITRQKGGARRPPFLVDDSAAMRGHAYLTSSSENEASQESDRIGASFFTHYLVSGLRGAADLKRDGRVTLNELYQHAFAETLARTEATAAGPQHPAYDIQLTGTGDLVLSDVSTPVARLSLDPELDGRVFVRDENGRLVAELGLIAGTGASLALPEGDYSVTIQKGESFLAGTVKLKRGDRMLVSRSSLAARERERTRSRGDELVVRTARGDDREYVPIVFGFVPGMTTYSEMAPDVALSLNLLVGHVHAVRGAHASGIVSITEGPLSGFSWSGVGNIVKDEVAGFAWAGVFNIVHGPVRGFQWAGVFNIADGDVSFLQMAYVFNIDKGALGGAQLGGVFNMAEGEVRGVQGAGVFNISHGDVKGLQFGCVFNKAEDVSGAQIGVVNIGAEVRGAQIGIVNISDEVHGLAIGLVTITRDGIMNASWWRDSQEFSYVGFQLGTRHFYTVFFGGSRNEDWFNTPRSMVKGLGFGVRFTAAEFLFLDADLSAKTYAAAYPESVRDQRLGAFDEYSFPSARISGGVRFGRHFGVFGGVTWDIHVPGITRTHALNYTSDSAAWRWPNGRDVYFTPKFFAGISL